ncbi:hypothetical protein CMV_010776 [Castanea mollissima]|uniref:Uncharacterized protein n=1 Tax=Castanea mollissima TaxID=60419 RepID=A0A8J4R648_9ROSI|nr:hypothetical protein CMV_010776 [Castanea mollissima]
MPPTSSSSIPQLRLQALKFYIYHQLPQFIDADVRQLKLISTRPFKISLKINFSEGCGCRNTKEWRMFEKGRV